MKKKLLAILLVVAMAVTFAVPALAANNGNGNGNGNNKTAAAPVDEFDFDVNNANFHCNDIVGENGRVWPDLTNFGVVDGKGNGGGNNKNKMAGTFHVDRVGDSTTWSLVDVVVCPICGSIEWVTFSNNSGVPDGNNVQFQHNGPTKFWLEINKTWQDYYGNKISAPEGADVRFTVFDKDGKIAWSVLKNGDLDKELENVKVGKYLVNIADGPFTVEETVGFDGYTVNADTVTGITEKKSTAAFVNKEDFVEPILTIYKVWLDADGVEIEDDDEIAALNELVAFDGADVVLGENVFDAEQDIAFSEIVDADEFDFVNVVGDGVEDEDVNAVAIALKHKGVYEVTFTNQVAGGVILGAASINVYKVWSDWDDSDVGASYGGLSVMFTDGDDVNTYGDPFDYEDIPEEGISVTITEIIDDSAFVDEDADYTYSYGLDYIEVYDKDMNLLYTIDDEDSVTLDLYDEDYTLIFYNVIDRKPIETPDPTDIYDKIPSKTHVDKWWDDFGILAYGASSNNDKYDYYIAFSEDFWDVNESVTIGFGVKDNWEIRATIYLVDDELYCDIIDFRDPQDGGNVVFDAHYTNGGAKNTEFAISFGAYFDNPYDAGAMQLWLLNIQEK